MRRLEIGLLPPVSGIDDSELLAANDSTADMRKERDAAMSEREELRAEQANKLMNLPMNVNDLGTLRPGDF